MDEVDFYLEDLKSKFKKIKPEEFFLAYSGGKDSHLLYWFIKEYAHIEGIEVIACNTYMEHPEIRERMYKYADKVLLPALKPFEIKEKYGIPCFSKLQDDHIDRYQRGSRCKSTMMFIEGKDTAYYKLNKKAKQLLLDNKLHKISPKCCKILKKNPIEEYKKQTGKKEILGVCGGESKMRKSRYTSCFTKNGKFTPLHDLSDELMDKIYLKYNIELPQVYKHISRTGCMGCPYVDGIRLRNTLYVTRINYHTKNNQSFLLKNGKILSISIDN